jgi:hypothetical protein
MRKEERQEPARVAISDVPLLHTLLNHVALIDVRTIVLGLTDTNG